MNSLTEEQFGELIKVKLLQSPADKYCCSLCKRLLQRAFQVLPCGHRYCYKCRIELGGDNGGIARCVVDNEIIEHAFEDKSAQREIMGLKCLCHFNNYGCTWQDTIGCLLDHLKICEFAVVKCTYFVNGCNEMVPRNKLTDHLNTCPYKPRICNYCQFSFLASEIASHEQKCPEFPIACPDCDLHVPRGELLMHQRINCPNATKPCPRHEIGCSYLGNAKGIERHAKSEVTEHLKLVGIVLSNCDNLRESSSCALSEVNKIVPETERDTANLRNDVLILRDDMEALCRDTDIKRSEVRLLQTSIKDFSKSVSVAASNFDAAPKQIVRVRRQCGDIQALLNRTKTRQDVLFSHIANKTMKQNQRSKTQSLESFMSRTDAVEKQNETLRGSITELELSFRCVQNVWIRGKAIWKVDKFTVRLREAVRGEVYHIFSPPLFTSSYGFKFCFMLYLNGDKARSNSNASHISFYVRLMRTEFDHVLKYPFSREIKVSLLDQNTEGKGKDIVRIIYPEGNLYAYRKPVGDMNPPVGFEKFCSHHDLFRGTYLNEDVLFFKVEVERYPNEIK